jgi:hypothetical protein
VTVDVKAVDEHATPVSTILCECKHWGHRVPQTVVHAFRTVVQDSGANTGLLIATLGFQVGAYDASTSSNVRIVTWPEFQYLFASRWYANYGALSLAAALDPLIEYTEPINTRIFRKADALPQARRDEFKRLRKKHIGLGLGLLPLLVAVPGKTKEPATPPIPLRRVVLDADSGEELPRSIAEATSLRSFLTAVSAAANDAIAEFDEAFGERA